jgi:DNA polymerase IV (DinB-like DNA polymerase)
MSAAKVASDRDKPDGLVVVEPGAVREFFDDLPVEDVHGVGPVTARELAALDIETAGDLAAADPELLAERFGERGREIRRYARGEDERSVTPKGDPKSLSRESAFTDATTDIEAKCRQVRTLADAVADRAERKGARYQTIGIKVVTPPFDVNTRARSLPGPVEEPELVRRIALDLLGEFADDPVRKVGVRVSNLDFSAGEQANLDGFGGDNGSEEASGSSRTSSTPAAADELDDDGQVGLGTFVANDGDTEAAEDTAGEGTDASETHISLPPGQTTLAEF